MKRREWILTILPLFFVWSFDHYTKTWGQSLLEPFSVTGFTFRLFHNHGAFLGLFSDLPALLRMVSLSTLGAFLVFSYAIIQYLLPIKSVLLRIGMSILLGGILGNVSDRISYGYVIDFIIIEFPFGSTHPLNLADLFQWLGYAIIAIALIKEDQILWPENNLRRRLWIYPNYQFRYIFFLLVIALSLTLIGSVFSYTYLKSTIFELIGDNQFIPNRFLLPYITTYFTITLIYCGFLIVIGRRVSHRNAGPIYAFNKYINDLLEGRNRRFKLRAADEFKQLEVIGANIAQYLQENHLIDQEDNEKILTSQSVNSEDLTLGAVPIEEQIPNYKEKKINAFVRKSFQDSQMGVSAIKFRDCPICGTSSLQALPKSGIEYLVECPHCHYSYDPRMIATPRSQKGPNEDVNDGDFTINSARLNDMTEILKVAIHENPSLGSLLYCGPNTTEMQKAVEQHKLETCSFLPTRRLGPLLQIQQKNHTPDEIKNSLSFLGKFDLIILDHTLEQALSPNRLLTECINHLNTGGLILVLTPNISSSSAISKGTQWVHLVEHENIGFFDQYTLPSLFEKHSLNLVGIKSFPVTYSVDDLRREPSYLSQSWKRFLNTFLSNEKAKEKLVRLNTGLIYGLARLK